ncbi:MAG TPA: transketolase C-terminal domain-containing protein [bacterium]|nr:transketolase C-terminal domain-containing protein [bacterium]
MAAKATRQTFGETLAEIGATHPNVVVMDADLSKSTMSKLFAAKYPDRFFELGIAESNMVGAAAGMALCGKIPFICSFACFLTGRYETIRISVAYSQVPVRIVGTHAGIGIGEDGNSQMGLEDLTIMRALPHMTVIQPADDIETRQAVQLLATNAVPGPAYLRLTRQKLEAVNKSDYRFQLGKGVVLRDGSDMTILATGGVVHNSLKAAELLTTQGINARVVNIHTVKPIDADLIEKCARETKAFLTVEDHNIVGGMGGAVAEVLADRGPFGIRMLRWGIQDRFGESGSPEELYQAYGLDVDGILAKAKEVYARI